MSFQRYPYPPAGMIEALPRSCGALPILRGVAVGLAVPCPFGEALWIGLVRDAGTGENWRVQLDSEFGTTTVEIPPAIAIPGLPRGDGTWWALAREAPVEGPPACAAFELRVPSGPRPIAPVCVELLDTDRFETMSGRSLAPLDVGSAYGGWRLP